MLDCPVREGYALHVVHDHVPELTESRVARSVHARPGENIGHPNEPGMAETTQKVSEALPLAGLFLVVPARSRDLDRDRAPRFFGERQYTPPDFALATGLR